MRRRRASSTQQNACSCRSDPEPSGSAGRFVHAHGLGARCRGRREAIMHGIIYIIGLIVVIMAILSLFGLR
jgi:hypothetical protein